jgi:Domain of unknown function (DUF4139)/N-terminal domain of unknown function (DUF4140)
MNAPFWLASTLACAQFTQVEQVKPATNIEQVAPNVVENAPIPKPSASKIVAVTVYHGQALVTREVIVPEGAGVVELVVTPLPPETVAGSLYTEGNEGVRVLSTRFRTRAVKEDTRQEVRAREDLIKKLGLEAQRIEKEAAVHEQDLQYLSRLEGFTAMALNGLSDKGRLDSDAILALSKFVMDSRGVKSASEIDLRQKLQGNAEAADFARKQLAELSSGSSRLERDAVIVVQKSRLEPGTVRLGHLVGAANWWPQYRLRGAADNAPVRLEYLAAVVQQTGEVWPDVRVTLSTARPSLDAAPPDLLPLKMDIAGNEMPRKFGGVPGFQSIAPGMANAETEQSEPLEAQDDRSRRIAYELDKLVDMPFKTDTPLGDVLDHIRRLTKGPAFPDGIPIYADPIGLQDSDKTLSDTVVFDLKQVSLRTSLNLLLKQLGLTFGIHDGLLHITSSASDDVDELRKAAGGSALAMDQAQTSGIATLNRRAAGDQAEEMRVDGQSMEGTSTIEKDGPSVSYSIAGNLGIPSRRDPQLLEVGRVELPAEYYAKAVPVLTPRVYRLAKLTNTSELVLLPGEATAYVGTEFVGRMKLPLVAVGEPFIAGFGVDPQLQVARRLIRKARTVQGGNQVFSYEFRIGLRNYRPGPVKVQLWDRLPDPAGEAVIVNLVKTSAELSTDALYQRTARADNLLRWDLEVPPGTVGDKTMYLNYEFRLEYAKDLPQPRFLSGGLAEAPIGGGAMGGMGGMGGSMMGGMRSVPSRDK